MQIYNSEYIYPIVIITRYINFKIINHQKKERKKMKRILKYFLSFFLFI